MNPSLTIYLICALSILTVGSHETSEKATDELIDKLKHRLDDATANCLLSTGAHSIEVDQSWHDHSHTQSRSLKCYLQCMYKMQNYINESGGFVSDNIVAAIANATKAIVDECDTKAANIGDDCDRVYEFSFCLTHAHDASIAQLL
ncbi:hypothetical protein RI129_011037 [Pyrocoelia pectoralis]|uniref:Uncharacterized protein n=1 Tax=Pyrocoelia pectoralis TaxID=417401 RepID=A0AAN7V7B7_9COLE